MHNGGSLPSILLKDDGGGSDDSTIISSQTSTLTRNQGRIFNLYTKYYIIFRVRKLLLLKKKTYKINCNIAVIIPNMKLH